jgi:peptidyl-prolyl cis-trans isomerase A (cyclophilin A)
MEAVDKINAEYRENPDQGLIQSRGNAYLTQQFPRLTS